MRIFIGLQRVAFLAKIPSLQRQWLEPSTGWRAGDSQGVTETRVDDHFEAPAKIHRLLEADDRSTALWAAKSHEVIAIRSDRPVVEKVIVAHFGPCRLPLANFA
jgi:hypothetical protein